MIDETPTTNDAKADAPVPVRSRRKRATTSLYAAGEPMVWLTSGSLAFCVAMIVGLLVLIFAFGMSTFWPTPVVHCTMENGEIYMGEVTRHETVEVERQEITRSLLRTGNYRLTGTHFKWVDDHKIKDRTEPEWAMVMERMEWGRFYGMPQRFAFLHRKIAAPPGTPLSKKAKQEQVKALLAETTPAHGGTLRVLGKAFQGGKLTPTLAEPEGVDKLLDITGVAEVLEGPESAWEMFRTFHGEVRARWHERRGLEKHDIGDINDAQNEARLDLRWAELHRDDMETERGKASTAYRDAVAEVEKKQAAFNEVKAWVASETLKIQKKIRAIDEENARYILVMKTVGEGPKQPADVMMTFDQITRAYPANRLSLGQKLSIYFSRWGEYLTAEPREANSEGGVFPAIFGTILMTMLMAVFVVPFGVLAALYLREYAKAGPVVSAVRIAVNNLAGVPSIVFGVFGLGFFCYAVGGFMDGGPSYAMPKAWWFGLLAGLVAVSVAAFVCFMMGISKPGQRRTTRQNTFRHLSLVLWLATAAVAVALIVTTPFFKGFYRASLPNPTFGKGALIWASFTLALLTLPVVIVATEEALSAVPNSMREGSYACGASKWQTIKRIVLPRAMPGIMTGMILAMARGAGEVAPLMLVGAVKMAPELPFAAVPPFGINRSFMHLGFHIYDVGFQSQNSEAAKPMVYTTTLLLILIVLMLNVFAIWLRTRLKRKFVSSQF
jgi:ABC-type phosphate transport system permease subunit